MLSRGSSERLCRFGPLGCVVVLVESICLFLLDGSSHLVNGLVHPSDWCGLTLQKSHVNHWGYNPLTSRGMSHHVSPWLCNLLGEIRAQFVMVTLKFTPNWRWLMAGYIIQYVQLVRPPSDVSWFRFAPVTIVKFPIWVCLKIGYIPN